MEEHKMLLNFAEQLKNIAKEIKDSGSVGERINKLKHIVKHLEDSESHYVWEENVLFPYIEKHGVTEPPAIMWMEHNKIREIKKNLHKLIDAHKDIDTARFIEELNNVATSLAELFLSHFYKENKILFPTALEVISDTEWRDMRHQFDELGYCCFTPEPAKLVREREMEVSEVEVKGISFETGALSKAEIEAIFDTLPVDITFVDKEDTVRYFNQSKERIFPRAKAVIGIKVQQCHPQKSIHIVNQILEDFKNGRRDVAEFWINLKGRLIHIRYFAVRDKNKNYLGCLEVTQDITDIKKIEGEKRLLQ
ncbi:MAG: DUF438 domain-containing protein [Candidatus Odinarchaeia archaeon]